MKDKELRKRISEYRADFEKVTGRAFEHFFCPILMRDEPAELCRGHIENDAFGGKLWVPQRKDVDNFYGSVAEADLVSVVEDRDKDPTEVLLDKTLRRRHRPRLEFEGEPLGFYFPATTEGVPSKHTVIQVTGKDGEQICNIGMKMSHEEILAIAGKDIQVVVDRDYRPAVIAAMLKAAHLTIFRMLGYQHVMSPTGQFVADILAKFFDAHKADRSMARTDVDKYFIQFENMIAPIVIPNKQSLKGTVNDSRLISCFSTRQEVFAIGVIVNAGRDTFCVFLPTDCGKAINTYFSFLKEPPEAISIRITQFNPERDGGAWEIPPGEPILLPLRQPMPR